MTHAARVAPLLGSLLILAVLALFIAFEPIVPVLLWPVRIIFAGVAVMLVPGYTLQAALFPRQEDLKPVERAGLSFGLSIAAIAVMALVVDALPWGVQLWPVLGILALWSLISSVIAWYRRRRLVYQPSLDHSPLPVRMLLSLGAVVALASLAALISFPMPGPAQSFTEFYLLGREGLAAHYQQRMVVDEPFTLNLGVTNREPAATTYRVVVERDGQLLQELPAFEVASGASIELPVALVLREPDAQVRLDVLLYRTDVSAIYRALHLTVQVVTKP